MANSEIIGAGQDTERPAPKTNTIYQENCISTMLLMPDCFVDLTVTSPPYDNMRKYNMFDFKFDTIATELYRVTKSGGVVVWVVNDKTENGSETGTSFRQALFFQEIGFNLETMIWEKTGSGCLGSQSIYAQNFEYMFILSKGSIKTHNLICDRENKVKHGSVKVNQGITDEGKATSIRIIERKPFGKRNNIWRFDTQKNSSHPAPFPEQLAQDHILSWSNTGDLVYDPFLGSGTTAKMALVNGRNFIGSEVSEEYCRIAEERIHALRSPAQNTMEICHTAPNSGMPKQPQLALELGL
jgi:site-specific DNA-methyltransferase (adenine-specific)